MISMYSCLFFVVGALLLVTPGEGVEKTVSGVLVNNGWTLIDKFCFDTSGYGRAGVMGVTLMPDTKMKLLFYSSRPTTVVDGLEGQVDFRSLYFSDLPCSVKESMAQASRDLSIEGIAMSLTPLPTNIPQYWYVVLSACNVTDVPFVIRTAFQNDGGWWVSPLSFDLQGLPETFIAFTVVFSLLFIAMLAFLFVLRSKRMLHPIVFIFFSSIASYLLSNILLLAYYVGILRTDIPDEGAYISGHVFGSIAQLLFLVGLLILAKGWGVTTSKLSRKRDLFALLGIVVFAYVAIFIYDALRDRALVKYLYEGPAGYALLILRICVFLAFLMLLKRTFAFETNETKRGFFIVFAYVITVYFVAYIALMLSVSFLPDWYRVKVAEVLRLSVDTLGYLAIPVIIRPRKFYEVYNPTSLKKVRIPTMKEMTQVKPVAMDTTSDGKPSPMPGVGEITVTAEKFVPPPRHGFSSGGTEMEVDHDWERPQS
uniref:GPR180/TMEM145 transmembrane domain-containing protein n=1 Tax=Palpitomonas bilix TaxID=652834 RepID=A0A7S3GG86_9EUKA|mmetsp:Transcript_48018/g.124726  ORF Transcript_48018/g.124726 Transcript_48018/m.124726 type:complete len:482 (+) Transcript_48018:747-2192(+)